MGIQREDSNPLPLFSSQLYPLRFDPIEGPMSYRLHFTIMGLPKTTNAGGRSHWAVKVKESKSWKRSVYLASSSQLPQDPLSRARVYLTRHSSGKIDYDGLVSSFKHVLDGLVDAGVLKDDSMRVVDMFYLKKPAKPGQGKIEVYVEEIE
jgi:Holliday junction resolvase RusA-like endonuclease